MFLLVYILQVRAVSDAADHAGAQVTKTLACDILAVARRDVAGERLLRAGRGHQVQPKFKLEA